MAPSPLSLQSGPAPSRPMSGQPIPMYTGRTVQHGGAPTATPRPAVAWHASGASGTSGTSGGPFVYRDTTGQFVPRR